jgi:hypothetical protein
VAGKQGKALGQFGEAHFIALSPKDEIYVADTLNWRAEIREEVTPARAPACGGRAHACVATAPGGDRI